MDYFSDRNHLTKKEMRKTFFISSEVYGLLYDTCERYLKNMAWKYPEKCPDGGECCGVDEDKLIRFLKYEIPDLYNNYNDKGKFGRYAILDLIEFLARNMKDIRLRRYHEYFRHTDYKMLESREIVKEFQSEINDIFGKTGLLYTLTDSGTVERDMSNELIVLDAEQYVSQAPESGLRALLEEVFSFFKDKSEEKRKVSIEKLWDAFERLKTYDLPQNKADSVKMLIERMANENEEFKKLFNEEFKKLTEIGNKFRIRHHEVGKFEITDMDYCDYFVNRCLSLVILAIKKTSNLIEEDKTRSPY